MWGWPIGASQHLLRIPGDHGAPPAEILGQGIGPGRCASMLEPRQSSGASSEAPEASAASGREMRTAESLRLPLMRDDETDLLGFDDEGDGVGKPRRPWRSRRVIAAVA